MLSYLPFPSQEIGLLGFTQVGETKSLINIQLGLIMFTEEKLLGIYAIDFAWHLIHECKTLT